MKTRRACHGSAEQDNGIIEQMGQWVTDNEAEFNIEMFLHEGDLVQNHGSDNDDEWDIALDAIGRIDDADVPTVLALGNDDKHGHVRRGNRHVFALSLRRVTPGRLHGVPRRSG